VKLFQIEEPEGGPADPNAAGAAIGIDASGRLAEAAFSVGGNALVLSDREGFEQVLSVPGATAVGLEWQELFGNAKIRAERALARPVTHAVVVVAPGSAKIRIDCATQREKLVSKSCASSPQTSCRPALSRCSLRR